jgi:ArsR family transcriptional regulator, arsenate/arsenite/antimonite-responsive transcriptional repressor
MGASKTDTFTAAQNEIAVLAKALGHPARIAIIEFLLRQEGCICRDIVDELPLSQATVSQHLRELKNAGLIQGTIEGNRVCYCVNTAVFQTLMQYFSIFLNKKDGFSCC